MVDGVSGKFSGIPNTKRESSGRPYVFPATSGDVIQFSGNSGVPKLPDEIDISEENIEKLFAEMAKTPQLSPTGHPSNSEIDIWTLKQVAGNLHHKAKTGSLTESEKKVLKLAQFVVSNIDVEYLDQSRRRPRLREIFGDNFTQSLAKLFQLLGEKGYVLTPENIQRYNNANNDANFHLKMPPAEYLNEIPPDSFEVKPFSEKLIGELKTAYDNGKTSPKALYQDGRALGPDALRLPSGAGVINENGCYVCSIPVKDNQHLIVQINPTNCQISTGYYWPHLISTSPEGPRNEGYVPMADVVPRVQELFNEVIRWNEVNRLGYA